MTLRDLRGLCQGSPPKCRPCRVDEERKILLVVPESLIGLIDGDSRMKYIKIFAIFYAIFCGLIYASVAYARQIDKTEECNISELYCVTSNIIRRNNRIDRKHYHRIHEENRRDYFFDIFLNFASNADNKVFFSLIDRKLHRIALSKNFIYDNFLAAPLRYIPLEKYYKTQIITKKINKINFVRYDQISCDDAYADDIDSNEVTLAIDNAIKILNNYPESLEAVFFMLEDSRLLCYIACDEIRKKCSDWLDINIRNDSEVARKLLYCIILSRERNRYIINATADGAPKNKILTEIDSIKNNCNDARYRALATAFLCHFNFNSDVYEIEFIKNFPDHVATPYIKLMIIETKVFPGEYQKLIREIKSILNKHKNLMLPTGWKLEIYCYYILAHVYYELDDFNSFIKYRDLIKRKAPEHYYNGNLDKAFIIMQHRRSKPATNKNMNIYVRSNAGNSIKELYEAFNSGNNY